MNITFKDLETAEEELQTRRLARRCFPLFYRLFFITRFKKAVLAKDGPSVIGAATWKIFSASSKKIGCLEFCFTDSDSQGRGVGRETYTRAIEAARQAGADHVSAIVLEDNTASWQLMVEAGATKLSLPGLIQNFGLLGSIKTGFSTGFFMAPGSGFWVTDVPEEKPKPSLFSVLLFLLLNAGSAGFFSATKGGSFLISGGIMVLLLGIRLIISGIAAVMTKPKYRFSLWNGGVILPVVIPLFGGFFPFGGNFYPKDTAWNAHKLRRSLGIVGLMSWLSSIIFLGCIMVLRILNSSSDGMFALSLWPVFMIIMYDSAYFLMEEMAGNRVYRWNRKVYVFMLLLSVVVLVTAFKSLIM